MSGNPQPDAAAMQSLVQAGQAFAQGFMSFLAQQHNAASAAVPQNEAIVGLQKAFAERHAALWQSMLQHGQGTEGRVEVKDKRFAAPAWSESPYFDYLRQAYLLNAEFLDQLAEAVPADAAARERLKFFTRQFVDAMAPSNFVATNPEFIQTALKTQGASITAGIQNLIADLGKGRISMTDDAAFGVGRNLDDVTQIAQAPAPGLLLATFDRDRVVGNEDARSAFEPRQEIAQTGQLLRPNRAARASVPARDARGAADEQRSFQHPGGLVQWFLHAGERGPHSLPRLLLALRRRRLRHDARGYD